MANESLQLKCERRIFTDKSTQEQRPYYVFFVDINGLSIPLSPKDATAKQLLITYFNK